MDATPDEPRKDDALPPQAPTPPAAPPPAEPPKAAPVESTPAPAAPVEATPVEPTPVEATPVEAAPSEARAPAAAPAAAPEASATSAPAEVTAEDATPNPTEAPADARAPDEEGAPVAVAATEEAAASDDTATPDGEATPAEGKDAAPKKKAAKKKKKRKPKPKRRPPPKAPERPLTPELEAKAADAAIARVVEAFNGKEETVRRTIDLLTSRMSIPFLARFRRSRTGGLDEARLREVLRAYQEILEDEQHRVRIEALLIKRGGHDESTAKRLADARSVPAMDDLAAPYLPVMASRATVARGQGLQGLADAIRSATNDTPLSELAKPFVKLEEGQTEIPPTALDAALGGARDILAEDMGLDVELRVKLRELFRKAGVITVIARSEKRGEAKAGAPSNPLIGYTVKAAKIPPIKVLALRRAEKQRAVVASIEPPEAKAIELVHAATVPAEHPHGGFLRAAVEDGYRRILKPLFQNEMRVAIKQRADEHAMDQYERSLRNQLLGPYAGARRVLGLRPDVMKGHRWCAVDEAGNAAGSGTLPHAPTIGREGCLTEFTDILKTYEISAIAVGTTGGRADALSLAKEAAGDIEASIEVAEVSDGGTRALESMGPVEFENNLVVPAECRGALSLGRRFQDPLPELLAVDPKALALGPHMHDVHQGRLRQMLEQVIESCVAHIGVDPNKAGVDLLARTPGFTRRAAESFIAWREQAGPLREKAGLAAIEGVGPKVAEQAVGFLRLSDAPDTRDRAQLHPEQYAAVERMAAQVETDIATLFSDANARKRVNLDALTDKETSAATLKYILFQATAGLRDPRPRFANPIPPPEGMTLQALADIVSRRGEIELQGRVIRAAPFGVFVDVGMGVEALIPIPHIGDRPGIDPSTIAPVGAVVTARVLEVDQAKKRLTLSMRRGAPRGRPQAGRGPGGRPPQRGGGRGPRDRAQGGSDRRPVGAGAGARDSGGGGARGGGARGGDARGGDARGPRQGGGARGGDGRGPRTGATARGGDGRGASQGGGARGGDGRGPRTGGGDGRGPRTSGGDGRGPRSGGGGGRGGDARGGRQGGRSGGFKGGGRREGGGRSGGGGGFERAPRKISLSADEPTKGKSKVDESKMSPEELMQYKLDQMRKKLERPDA